MTAEADEAEPAADSQDKQEDKQEDEQEGQDSDEEMPAAQDTVTEEPARGGLRNRRPSGKMRRPRLRRKSGGVAVEPGSME